ncbi:hypothetical protein Y697_08620 [Mesotoga sp. BH458_6_3_2_1]|nr:hypothetical protein Y697_08620 [Mesotoga sp. BH458_6_3_2_1]
MLAGARKNKTIDARLGKNGPGRKAAFGRRRFLSQSAAQASHLRWQVALRAASSGYAGQTKTVEKERCGEVRCAHERRERERRNQ